MHKYVLINIKATLTSETGVVALGRDLSSKYKLVKIYKYIYIQRYTYFMHKLCMY